MVLEQLLARQAGVVSREQALRAGLDAATVDRMVRTRRWQPLHPRVYLVRGYPAGDEARARAAVLWAGAGAVLSGAAAAWWHGLLAEVPGTLAVTAPTRRPARPGVVVRCRPLGAVDRTERRGLPVTAAGLTALEAAAELGRPAGEDVFDQAVQRIGWAEVLAAHRRNPTLAGAALLAAAAEVGEALTRLLRRSELRGWYPRPPATVVFPAARLLVTTATRALPEGDPGWRVIRVDRGAVADRPAGVLAAITAALGRDLHHLDARIGPSTGISR